MCAHARRAIKIYTLPLVRTQAHTYQVSLLLLYVHSFILFFPIRSSFHLSVCPFPLDIPFSSLIIICHIRSSLYFFLFVHHFYPPQSFITSLIICHLSVFFFHFQSLCSLSLLRYLCSTYMEEHGSGDISPKPPRQSEPLLSWFQASGRTIPSLLKDAYTNRPN